MSTRLVFNPATAELQLQNVADTIGVEGRVLTFADLPAVALNTGNIYIVETDTGSIFLLNKREAGLYRSNGVTWQPYSDVSALSIETLNTNIGAPASNVQSALEYLKSISAGGLTWTDYATLWDVAPVLNKAIIGGNVFTYQYQSNLIYRFVPTTYASVDDAFYGSFNSTTNVLSVLLARRTN